MIYRTLFLNRIIACLFLLLAFATHSFAATLTVCAGGGCDHLTITAAINAAVDGDTVLVSDGVYSETLNYGSKIITIQSQNGAASATIQGDGSNAPVITFANSALNASAVLDGFTIDNQSDGQFFTQGILISSGAAPTLRNLLIKGNSVSVGYYGGGIKIDGGGVSIHDSTIGGSLANKNSAARGGGIYAVNSALPITINNSNFTYNNATDAGGAIYLTNISSELTITDSFFDDNFATNRGGAISSDMAAISITSTSMVRNVANVDAGGAIYHIGSASSITVTSSILSDNTVGTSGGRGGAIYSAGAVVNISNTNLDRNSSGAAGAAIYISGVSAMNTIINSTLNDNSALNRGAAIYSDGVPFSITDTTIDGNNTSNFEGGALYLKNSGAALIITGGTFTNNVATSGGAIYMTEAESLSITGTTLTGNTCLYHGGAIYLGSLSATSTITNSTISNSIGSGRGGAIYNANSPLTINDTDMDNHSSNEGAAIYLLGLAATTTITGGSISNNTADYTGGAMYMKDGANVTVTSTTINSNTVNLYNGGAIAVSGAGTTLNFFKTTISGNETHQRGGAIVVGASAVVTLNNCMVTGNVADGEQWSEGGGIMNYGTVNIYNSTFAGNYAWGPWGGGGGLRSSGTATIKNSIFWGNRATPGAQIQGTATVTYSDIEGGYSGTGNIDLDPLFVNLQQALLNSPTAAGDFHIQVGSPVLDHGTSIGAPADDIDGDRRPIGDGIDMGADEAGVVAGNELPVGGYITDKVIPSEQVTQSLNGDGTITINWKGRDSETDNVVLNTFQYSIDGGTVWSAPLSGDLSTAFSTDWNDNGGGGWSTAITFVSAAPHSFSFDTDASDVSGMAGLDLPTVQVRFRLHDAADSAAYVTSESFRVDNQAPTHSYTSATYISSTDTITITGTQFTTLGDAAAEIKNQVDWSKLSWDIDGDSETTDVGFVVSDVTSLTIDSDTSMTLVLTSAKATAIEAMPNFASTGGDDTLDFTAGFSIDAAGNVSTTDAAANMPLYISEFPALIVTKSEDTDGNCTLLDCSLREAVKAANASPGASIIKFQASTNGSTIAITRTGIDDINVNGDFDITNPVYIVGNGPGLTAISGGSLDRVFHVINSSAATVDGATVTSGSLTGEGGCIYAADGVTIRDSILTSCTATSNNGGALYAIGEVSLDNVIVDSNTAGGSGGGIYAGSVVATNGVTFTSNQADIKGGGIYSSSTISIDGTSLFDNNDVGGATPDDGDDGGAIYAESDVTLNSTTGITTFQNNDAANGGAIKIPSSGTQTLTMTAPIFNNNRALYTWARGGALDVDDVVINAGASATRFDGNTSAYLAGALDGYKVTVYGDIVFDLNTAGQFAGALYSWETVFNGDTTFTNNQTINKTLSGRGGAIYNMNKLTFEQNALFEGNQGRQGGAIEQVQFALTFKNGATFRNNHASQNGGAIALTGGWATLNLNGTALFEGNSTGTTAILDPDRTGGGAIFVLQAPNVNLNLTSGSNTFLNNTSETMGGAIRVHYINTDTPLDIKNATFEGNTAKEGGGALYMLGGTITSSTFTGNSADGSNGGAIYNATNALKIVNSTISGNSVTTSGEGGAIYMDAADCEVLNSTLYNNSAATGSDAIRGDIGATCTLYNTIVSHPTTSSSLCANVTSGDYNLHYNGSCFTAQANDQTGDPVFGALANNGGPTQTHAIGSSSGARDNALGAICIGADVNAVDQRGEIRTSQCDIGAYEYYAADDPDHFLISHDGYGIYCDANEVVTVTPKEIMGSDHPEYSKTIVLDTQTGKGSWGLSSGAGTFSDATANDGLATYTFSGSDASASFTLTYQEGDSALDIDVYEQGNSLIRDDDTEGTLSYSPSGFSITNSVVSDPTVLPDDIVAQTQNVNFTAYLTAFGTTANDATCGIIENYTGTKALKFWSSATGAFTIDASAAAVTEGAAVAQNVTFINGKAEVTGNYDSIGNISFSVKDDTVADTNLPTGIRGASNAFDVNAFSPWNTCDYTASPFACFNFYSLGDFIPLVNAIAGAVGVAGAYSGSQMTLQNLEALEYVLLVGGNATIGSGIHSSGQDGGKHDIEGNITYTGGAILSNDVHSGGSITAASGATLIDGSVYAATTITEAGGTLSITGTQNPAMPYTPQVNFTTVSNYFKSVSDTVGAMTNTTNTTNTYGALSATVVSGNNVTSVSAAMLLNAYAYTITGPSDAVLYINVTGSTTPSLDHTFWVYNGGIDKSHVLLNFSNANTLTISNDNQVNILAPYATVTALGGWVEGNLIVGDMINDTNVRLGHFTPTPPSGGGSSLDHFTIIHDELGIHCSPETIAVTPKQTNDSDFVGYTGTIVLDTQSSNGSWIDTNGNGTLTDAVADDGLATYVFSGTETYPVTFTLEYKSGTPSFNIDVYDLSDSTLRDDDAEGNITFAANGFTVTQSVLNNPSALPDNLPAQTAGTAFDMHITAYGTTPTDTTCGVIESYVGNKNLDFWFSRSDPTSGSIVPTINGAGITTTEGATQRSVTFAQGKAQVLAKYKDAGAISISMKDAGVSPVITGSSNQIVVRPVDFELSSILMPTTEGDCAGGGDGMVIMLPNLPDETASNTFSAAKDFCVTVTAVDSEGDVTLSFGQESTPESVKLTSAIVSAGFTNNPTVNMPTDFAFTNGVATVSDISWGEVGIISLTPSIKDGNYLGSGDVTGAASGDIGRFVPDHFTVEVTQIPELQTACVDGEFTYIGQSFFYAVNPVLTVTAENSDGAVTRNYAGDWFKLTASSIPYPIYTAIPGGLNPPSPEAPTIIDLGELDTADKGKGRLIFDSPAVFSFSRAVGLQVPFDAAIRFSVDVKDDDGVETKPSENPYIINPVEFTSGANMRFGRLKIENNRGSELLDLTLLVTIEYFASTAAGFITNTDDVCTTDITFTIIDPAVADTLAANETCVYENAGLSPGDIGYPGDSGLVCPDDAPLDRGYNETADNGDFNFWLKAPGAGNTGSLDVTLTPEAAANHAWLMYNRDGIDNNLDGDLHDDAPQGNAFFGGYQGNDVQIFLREVY